MITIEEGAIGGFGSHGARPADPLTLTLLCSAAAQAPRAPGAAGDRAARLVKGCGARCASRRAEAGAPSQPVLCLVRRGQLPDRAAHFVPAGCCRSANQCARTALSTCSSAAVFRLRTPLLTVPMPEIMQRRRAPAAAGPAGRRAPSHAEPSPGFVAGGAQWRSSCCWRACWTAG